MIVLLALLLVVADGRKLLAAIKSGQGVSTIEEIKARGYLKCGVSKGLVGFSSPSNDGSYEGFDADLCKAVAAAIGDVEIEWIPTTSSERFNLLLDGTVDMLSRTTTWTATRDRTLGLSFGGVNYYDGQGFMVKASIGSIKNLKEMGGVCSIEAGTTTIETATTFFRNSAVKIQPAANAEAVLTNVANGLADCVSSDASALAAMKAAHVEYAGWIILPELISKEPLGPVTREGDDQFSDLVRFVLAALVNAEELGITMENVDDMAVVNGSQHNAATRLLGGAGNPYESFGVDALWAKRAIMAVGNYGESFERNLGPLGLTRGSNALWTNGGLQYGIPI